MLKMREKQAYQKFLRALKILISGSKNSDKYYVSNVKFVIPTGSPQYCLTINDQSLQFLKLFAGDRHQITVDFDSLAIKVNGKLQSESFYLDFFKELDGVVQDLNANRAQVYDRHKGRA